MTQKTYSVSPLIPACPKPGASAPAFRPADQGDAAAISSTEEVCLSPIVPSRAPSPLAFSPAFVREFLTHHRSVITWALSLVIALSFSPPSHPHFALCTLHFAMIPPAWYRIISLRTAKRNFFFSLFFVALCALWEGSSYLSFGLSHSFVICALVICHWYLSFLISPFPNVATSLCRHVASWD